MSASVQVVGGLCAGQEAGQGDPQKSFVHCPVPGLAGAVQVGVA